jgi:hypothetical protein
MNNRLIIDSQLAAQDVEAVFGQEWSWPVAQAKYDSLVTEVIEWSDELHLELNDSPRLLNAFLLIKADLLKDLSYYLVGWLDVASAQESGVELVFNSNQYIYTELVSNRFTDRIPTRYYSSPKTDRLKARFRSRLSKIKRQRNNWAASRSTDTNVFLIGANPLGIQITDDAVRRVSISRADIARRRTGSEKAPNRVIELADQISIQIAGAISRITLEPSEQLTSHIRFMALEHLRRGWNDTAIKSMFKPAAHNPTLVSGTGSGYAARLISHQFLSEGHRVIRTSHGGDAPMFDDVMWPSIEFPFATKYIVDGSTAATAVSQSLSKRSEAAVPQYASSVLGVGSHQHFRIRESAGKPKIGPPKTVGVISASLTGMHRVTPHMKLHDVVYMEWHRRLLQDVRDLGYTVFSKRHPKGMMTDTHIFDHVSTEELLQTPMSSIAERTDAYVIDFPASALMESICTLKPVVLIDHGIRRMRTETRSLLQQSVPIVGTSYDQRNRVVIDRNELNEALEMPVNLDAREDFIQKYLLNPSPNIDSLFE